MSEAQQQEFHAQHVRKRSTERTEVALGRGDKALIEGAIRVARASLPVSEEADHGLEAHATRVFPLGPRGESELWGVRWVEKEKVRYLAVVWRWGEGVVTVYAPDVLGRRENSPQVPGDLKRELAMYLLDLEVRTAKAHGR